MPINPPLNKYIAMSSECFVYLLHVVVSTAYRSEQILKPIAETNTSCVRARSLVLLGSGVLAFTASERPLASLHCAQPLAS